MDIISSTISMISEEFEFVGRYTNYDTFLQTLVSLDYPIELYILRHLNYSSAHPLCYPCLSLVKYPKLLLGYHFIHLIILRHVFYFTCPVTILSHIIIVNAFIASLFI
jgi:hypothetical protein